MPLPTWKNITSLVFPEDVAGDRPSDQQQSFLMVFDRTASRPFFLPEQGSVLVGRMVLESELDEKIRAERSACDCLLELPDHAVSRRHAKIEISNGSIHLVDLGSSNGTKVNNKRVYSKRLLADGDTIAIPGSQGEFYLILFRNTPRRITTQYYDIIYFERQFEQMIAAQTAVQAKLAVIAIQLDVPIQDSPYIPEILEAHLNPGDLVAQQDDDRLLILREGMDGPEATELAEAITAAIIKQPLRGARGGIAVFPDDGTDAQTLIAGAAVAARRCSGGLVLSASHAYKPLVIDGVNIVVVDPIMVQTYTLLERLAKSDLSIFLCGETGTGKEVAAKAVHFWSGRKGKLVIRNCASIPDTLAASEFEGAARGSYTSLDHNKVGIFEEAVGGTVFLDEIAELSMENQAKLLRILSELEVTPIGSNKRIKLDFRIIAATNRNLEQEVDANRFRADLFARLNAATPVSLPPLRSRPRELPILARRFAADVAARLGLAEKEFSPAAMRLLASFPWPHNIRQLKNTIERTMVAFDGDTVLPSHLAQIGSHSSPDPTWRKTNYAPSTKARAVDQEMVDHLHKRLEEAIHEIAGLRKMLTSAEPAASVPPKVFRPIEEEVQELERKRMVEALIATRGVKRQAGRLLGMAESSFKSHFKDYKIKETEYSVGGDRPDDADDQDTRE